MSSTCLLWSFKALLPENGVFKKSWFSWENHRILQICVKSESNLRFQLPWVQIPFKIHANRGVLDQICVVGPESGRRQSILGLLRVLRIPRHRFGTTKFRMPQPTFCFRPLRTSLVNLNPWNPYCSTAFHSLGILSIVHVTFMSARKFREAPHNISFGPP